MQGPWQTWGRRTTDLAARCDRPGQAASFRPVAHDEALAAGGRSGVAARVQLSTTCRRDSNMPTAPYEVRIALTQTKVQTTLAQAGLLKWRGPQTELISQHLSLLMI